MKIINLTPHEITIRREGIDPLVYPPSGTVARVATSEDEIGVWQPDTGGRAETAITVIRRSLGGVTGLPAPWHGTAYLVSSMVLSACQGRADVYAPDTGATAVRDDAGRIVACTRLVAAQVSG